MPVIIYDWILWASTVPYDILVITIFFHINYWNWNFLGCHNRNAVSGVNILLPWLELLASVVIRGLILIVNCEHYHHNTWTFSHYWCFFFLIFADVCCHHSTCSQRYWICYISSYAINQWLDWQKGEILYHLSSTAHVARPVTPDFMTVFITNLYGWRLDGW